MGQDIVDNLIAQLTKLPGVGRKTAQRLAFFILSMPAGDAKVLGEAIVEVKEKAHFCSKCFNITGRELCEICSDTGRDQSRICVVEEPSNILVIERTRSYHGLYHALLGALSPLDGVTADRLRIKELVRRLDDDSVQEVILATNPNTKGEITAQYLTELIKPFNKRVTRLACGLPIGSDIEFADEVTLTKALEGRREL